MVFKKSMDYFDNLSIGSQAHSEFFQIWGMSLFMCAYFYMHDFPL